MRRKETMIHIGIVEDEAVYREQILEYIHRYETENAIKFKISTFSDGDEIVEKYSGDYDILFLDIVMRFLDGMSAAERIREMDEEVIIIFITNMTGYAIRGYAVDAMDYVLKPITYYAFSQKLAKSLKKIQKQETKEKSSITINVSSGVQRIRLGSIYYIESMGHNLMLHTKEGIFTTRENLKDIQERISNEQFFRVNKSYIVNLEHVEGIRGGSCIIGDMEISIGRSKKGELMQALANYIAGNG